MEQQARPGEEKIESGYANLDVGSIGGRHTGKRNLDKIQGNNLNITPTLIIFRDFYFRNLLNNAQNQKEGVKD